ncbi:MAG: substrate-binding domain-containing protein [Kiritimatiellae bacterium]|nr:substrate-binding domain-containing protein [Kiritimatiellia bacterium]
MVARVPHLVKLDTSSESPLYEQMSAQIASAIESGRLKSGDRLPSLKEWSSELGVGSWVPRRAMSELAKKGLVDVRRHMGAVVSAAASHPMRGKVVYLSIDRGNIWAREVFSFNFGEALRGAGYSYERVSVAGRRQDRAWPKSAFDFSHLRSVVKDGVSFAWVGCSAKFVVEPLIEAGVPFSVVGDFDCPEAVDVFREPCIEMAKEIVALLKKACCKSVMYVGYGRWIDGAKMASTFYSSGLRLSRLCIKPSDAATEADFAQRAALEEFERRLSGGKGWLPDAFVFSDDYVAAGALFALAHHGVEAPRDVKVVSFANKRHLPVYLRPLTRIENDPVRNGREAAKYVVSVLRGGRRHVPDIFPKLLKGATLLVMVLALPFALAARPMIDDAHDRVQTTLDPMMDRIGTLSPRSAGEVGPSRLAIGCEMLPRGYGEFENIKEYLPPLGIARVRLHAAWAKLEPQRGKWDFEWLDRQVSWLVENGMEPILETSYGNPVYPGAGGASLSDGMPRGEEALAAWDRYVDELARHYPNVKNWACWNEPNNIDANTPEIVVDNNIRTARIILKHIPDAKIGMLTLGTRKMNEFTEKCLKLFKERNALGLFTWIIYHDYTPNPDACYGNRVDAWAEIVRKYAPGLKIWNGESGATSDAHYSGGISSLKWNSELTQAKWDARRLVADLGHGFDSLVFTIYDPCYDQPERYTRHIPPYWVRTRNDRFMKRMGLLKCNDRLEVVKVKPAYYAVQNVAVLFDSTIEAGGVQVDVFPGEGGEGLVTYAFRQKGTDIPLIAFWDASRHPENNNDIRRATLSVVMYKPREPVWIDMVTGAIYKIPDGMVIGDHRGKKSTLFECVPYYDAPVVITELSLTIKGKDGKAEGR